MGPVILAPNHLSNLDPPLVGSALGTREVHYLAKEGLFKEQKFFAWLITIYNAIPLKEEGIDRRALHRLIEFLRKGEVVVIFPEGTRSPSGGLLPGKEGVGLVALRTQAPIVPVRVVGSNARIVDLILRRARLSIRFGDPLDVRRYGRSRHGLTQEVMRRIAALGSDNCSDV
jgi:1-acyl-sn-glycerol-3-phosphate acyltransferase